jgi:hypothetical protein
VHEFSQAITQTLERAKNSAKTSDPPKAVFKLSTTMPHAARAYRDGDSDDDAEADGEGEADDDAGDD